MFGIQLPQINIPQINIPNPLAGVQQTANNVVTTARNDITGAGTIVSSDVTQIYNVGRNVESNYVSPILNAGQQGANRIITAGNNVAATPGNIAKGAEEGIYNAGQTVVTDVNNVKNTVVDDFNKVKNAIFGDVTKVTNIPGDFYKDLEQKEQQEKDWITQQEQQLQSQFQQDMQSVDDAFSKFFQGLGGVVAPVATAGTDITKYIIIAVGGIVLVVIFLLFWGSRPRGRHS